MKGHLKDIMARRAARRERLGLGKVLITPDVTKRGASIYLAKLDRRFSIAARGAYFQCRDVPTLRRCSITYRWHIMNVVNLYIYGIYNDITHYELLKRFMSLEYRYIILRSERTQLNNYKFCIAGNITDVADKEFTNTCCYIKRGTLLGKRYSSLIYRLLKSSTTNANRGLLLGAQQRYIYIYANLRSISKLQSINKFHMFSYFRNFILLHSKLYSGTYRSNSLPNIKGSNTLSCTIQN